MNRASQMSFAAIDFETANQSPASVCQTGVAIVRNGIVEDVQEWLVQPLTGLDNFNPYLVQKHRITPRMAVNGLRWGESAERLSDLVGDLPVIAHNAQFDRRVYLAACELLTLRPSEWKWYCSLEISRAYLQLPSHSLDQLAAHLGVDIRDHHQAGSDAQAAAEVLLAVSQNSGIHRLDDLGLELPAPGRKTRRTSESTAAEFIPTHTISRYGRVSDLPNPNASADPHHPLHGEHVVLSGKIGEHDRDHWIEQLAGIGAQPQLNITNKTTIVVVGADAGKTKVADAQKRRANGQTIRTIPADDLIALLDPRPAGEIDAHRDEDVEAKKGGDLVAETDSPYVGTAKRDRLAPQTAERSIPNYETPPSSRSNPVITRGHHDAMTFQRWSGQPGTLPVGWTLYIQHRGREQRISTTKLNRSTTGLLKRVGALAATVIGSFVVAAILTPLLGPLAPVVFLGGIAYSIVLWVRSARADKLRWQFWTGEPEERKVLFASPVTDSPREQRRR